MYITKDFKFDSAHNLINYNGKCENLHGHTYRLRVTLAGKPRDDGMIIDFGELKTTVNQHIIERLDHHYLNDIVPLSTAENLAQWIWEQLNPVLHAENYRLYEITLWETETSSVTVREKE